MRRGATPGPPTPPSAAEILDSLSVGDHEALLREPWWRGMLGLIGLAAAGMWNAVASRPSASPASRSTDVMFVVANPVAHGARLASVVADTLSAAGLEVAVVADARLAATIDAEVLHFPALGLRSLLPFSSVHAVLGAWRQLTTVERWPEPLAHAPRFMRAYLFVAQFIRFEVADARGISCQVLLTDFDRASACQPLVRAARKAGVVAMTLVHGTPSEAYLPVIADVLLAWGPAQQAFFSTRAPSADVRVVGRVDIERDVSSSIPLRRVIICHSLEDLTPTEVARIRDVIARARRSGAEVEVRPHPRDPHVRRGGGWREVVRDAGRVRTPGESIAEYLRPGDLVVSVCSTSAVDAITVGALAAVVADADRQLSCDLAVLRSMSASADAGSGAVAQAREALIAASGSEARQRLAAVIKDYVRQA